jgi:hypothetical protein
VGGVERRGLTPVKRFRFGFAVSETIDDAARKDQDRGDEEAAREDELQPVRPG